MKGKMDSGIGGRNGCAAGMAALLLVLAAGCGAKTDADGQTRTGELDESTAAVSQESPITSAEAPKAPKGPKAPEAVELAESLPAVEPVRCEQVDRLGVLPAGDPVLRRVDTSELSHHFRVGCMPEGPAGAEYLVSFRVERRSTVQVDVNAFGRDALLEWRTGGCERPTATRCTDREADSILLEPGVEQVLAVQTRGLLEGPIEVEFRTTPAVEDRGVCAASGGTDAMVCREGAVSLCSPMHGELDWIQCADGCGNRRACAGDSCRAPLRMEAGRRHMTVEGRTEAYRDAMGTQWVGRAGGELRAVETPGEDIVVALEDMEAGEGLRVDAGGDEVDQVVTIRESCGGETVLAGNDLGDVLEWNAPKDGTYWLVVDRAARWPGAFEVEIERR